MNKNDRFKKIANNFGELFTEVFKEQGMDYVQFDKSVFDGVSKVEKDFKDLSILDVGIGDGISSAEFVNAGCKKITGIDLNQEMLDATRKKYGNRIRLFKMNAINMSQFKEREFDIIITGTSIHNILKDERTKFWKEILRLKPKIFVCAEKIKDSDPKKHEADYQKEIRAISKIYGEKYNLKEAEGEWIAHYEYDDREALSLSEIKEKIGDKYDISVVFEVGLFKTVLAVRKLS
jgi:ubiquinone/menaquinone biosynthesis C-methylase UbiE